MWMKTLYLKVTGLLSPEECPPEGTDYRFWVCKVLTPVQKEKRKERIEDMLGRYR